MTSFRPFRLFTSNGRNDFDKKTLSLSPKIFLKKYFLENKIVFTLTNFNTKNSV